MLITPHPVNTTVYEGEMASLQCRIRSELKPTVKWVKQVDPDTLLPEELANSIKMGKSAYIILPPQPVSNLLNNLRKLRIIKQQQKLHQRVDSVNDVSSVRFATPHRM